MVIEFIKYNYLHSTHLLSSLRRSIRKNQLHLPQRTLAYLNGFPGVFGWHIITLNLIFLTLVPKALIQSLYYSDIRKIKLHLKLNICFCVQFAVHCTTDLLVESLVSSSLFRAWHLFQFPVFPASGQVPRSLSVPRFQGHFQTPRPEEMGIQHLSYFPCERQTILTLSLGGGVFMLKYTLMRGNKAVTNFVSGNVLQKVTIWPTFPTCIKYLQRESTLYLSPRT